MMTIECKLGTIYPYGGSQLAIELMGHRFIAPKLRRLDCCRVWQDGDDEVSLLFDVADFDTVAQIVKPHRKPRMSEEQRQQLREGMEQVRNRRKGSRPSQDLERTFDPLGV